MTTDADGPGRHSRPDPHEVTREETGAAGGDANSAEVTLDQAVEMAVGMHKNGFAKAAEDIYRRVLSAAPDHVNALNFLGIACSQLGRKDEALSAFSRVLELTPDNADARNNLANLFLERGAVAEAESAYLAVLERHPDNPSARTNLGTILRRRGDVVGAEAAFRRALQSDPNHSDAHHQLGSVLRDTGRIGEALSAFRRALALRPYDGESHRRVGFALATLGRRDEAAEVYRRWLTFDPNNPSALHYLAACTGQDVPARATADYVQSTFDNFAASFDQVLQTLGYRAPQLTADAVAAILGSGRGTLDVLDAGAGTGLCGPLLRPYARRMTAVDLSPRMLEQAAARGVYDAVETADLTAYMNERPASFDLIVSADTLVYFGDLMAVLTAARTTLRPGGHLVFTVERASAGDADASQGYVLNPHGRYAHTDAYLEKNSDRCGVDSAVGRACPSAPREQRQGRRPGRYHAPRLIRGASNRRIHRPCQGTSRVIRMGSNIWATIQFRLPALLL
jgi:predicted TPR repeat methyltransferase